MRRCCIWKPAYMTPPCSPSRVLETLLSLTVPVPGSIEQNLVLNREWGEVNNETWQQPQLKCVPCRNHQFFLKQVINLPVSWPPLSGPYWRLCTERSTTGTLLPVKTSSCKQFWRSSKRLIDSIFLTHYIHCKDFAEASHQGKVATRSQTQFGTDSENIIFAFFLLENL